MKNIQLSKIILVIGVLIFASCTDDKYKNDFIPDTITLRQFKNITNPGLYEKGDSIFVLDKSIHQIYYKDNLEVYQISDENEEKNLKLTFEETPQTVGQDLKVQIVLNNSKATTETIRIVKMSEDKNIIWLWNADEKGIIINKF